MICFAFQRGHLIFHCRPWKKREAEGWTPCRLQRSKWNFLPCLLLLYHTVPAVSKSCFQTNYPFSIRREDKILTKEQMIGLPLVLLTPELLLKGSCIFTELLLSISLYCFSFLYCILTHKVMKTYNKENKTRNASLCRYCNHSKSNINALQGIFEPSNTLLTVCMTLHHVIYLLNLSCSAKYRASINLK